MFEEKAKLVSHVELTLSASIVVWTVTAILDQDWLGLGLPVFILAAILNVASCALAFLCLYKGILTRDVKKLKIWLIFNLVISILGLVAILLGMFFDGLGLTLGGGFSLFAELVYRGAAGFILFKFYQDVAGGKMGGGGDNNYMPGV